MRRCFAVLTLLLLAPLAVAKTEPTILFLADDDLPIGEGAMRPEWPDSNVSMVRLVTTAPSPDHALRFTGDANGTWLRGPVFAGIWPDRPLAPNGSLLRATLYVDDVPVANRSLPVHTDPSSLPDPMALLPPDPTDPQAAALHAVAQVLPHVYTPGMLVYFGFLDVAVPEDATISLTFEVVSAAPAPIGTILLKYDGIHSPSYLYLPWYTAEPGATQTQPPRPSATPSQTPTSEPSQTATADSKDSPGMAWAGLAALGVAWAVRRRL